MTTLTDRIPVDDISSRARQVRPSRVLATMVLGVFFAVGWVAGRTWLGTADCIIAVRVGWRQGRGAPPLEQKPPSPGT